MSLLHMDGFVQFTGLVGVNLTDAFAKAGYDGQIGSVTLAAGTAGNTSSLKFTRAQGTAAVANTLRRTVSTTADKLWFGFAVKATERAPLCEIADVLKLDWQAGISIGTTNGAAIPARNIWYFYEIEIDRVAKKANVYINNSLDLSTDISNEAAALTSYQISLAPYGGYTASSDMNYTDVVINDSSGTGKTAARLGPLVISTGLPTSDYLIQGDAPPRWAPASGTQHYQMVDNLPATDSENIQSGTTGAMDLFNSNSALVNANDVIAVGIVAQAKKTDIDNRKLGIVFGSTPGTQLEVIRTDLDLNYKMLYAFFDKAPGGAEWTINDATATPFGVAVR